MGVDATSSCVKPGIELVLWDFDGTLAYTSGDVWGSLCYAAERIGCRFVDGFEDDDVNLSLPMERIYASLVPRPDPSGLESFDQDVTRHTARSAPIHGPSFSPGCASCSGRCAPGV